MGRNVVVAVDGSENSMRALDYISMMFKEANLEVDLLYIMPALPPLFDDPKVRREAKKQLEAIEKRNQEKGEAILSEAKQRLEKLGLDKGRIRTNLEAKQKGAARDTCHFTIMNHGHAIVVGARGRSRLEKFFTGSVSGNIVQCSRETPVWLVNGKVGSKKVLLSLDPSENAMRAVEHAALMLADTQSELRLFYTKRDLSRFIPPDVIEAAPDIQEFWQTKAGEQIAPFIQKAVEKLKSAGISEDRISTEIIPGTRNPADDIATYARKNWYGTVVMGRHGQSDKKNEYPMGGVTGRVIQDSANLAVWVV
ncbi:MAG: universal stress protein [Desulfobacteraceae bacterium]|nr:universal stress protein [Desulfobacteraceae bacterium]